MTDYKIIFVDKASGKEYRSNMYAKSKAAIKRVMPLNYRVKLIEPLFIYDFLEKNGYMGAMSMRAAKWLVKQGAALTLKNLFAAQKQFIHK